MMDWVRVMQESIDYIESNLTSRLTPEEIAGSVYVSRCHFQRVFSLLSGMSVSEYIRMRRMTLAGQALSLSDARVIDVAMDYGYDSPESFCKAFVRFHGVNPSQSREPGVTLRSIAPLTFKIKLEGGIKVEYRIEQKEGISLIARVYEIETERSFEECPKCFKDYFNNGYANVVAPAIALCFGEHLDTKTFRYAIGDEVGYEKEAKIPEGMERVELGKGTWAVFPVKGALPAAIQNAWKRVYGEWLPSSGYNLVDGTTMEIYSYGDTSSEDYECELWVLVEKA